MKTSVHQRQIAEKRIEDPGDFPTVVLIDTVSFCNLRCSMCFHKDMSRKKGFMSWELFTKIIDEIAVTDKTVRVWMVFFGEALLLKKKKPTIFEMISYAKSKGLTDVVLNSNGALLDEASAVKLIDSGLDAIYFGVDAFTAETYAKLRVGADYEQTVKNISFLLEYQQKTDLKTPKVFVQFVEMERNRDEKEDFIRFWSEKGAIVKIRPMVSWAGMVQAPNLTLDNRDRWPCHWAMQTMSIAHDGRVVTCAVDLDARFVAGDITRQSLKEVWTGKLRELRALHRTGAFDALPANCRDCRDWQSAYSDYKTVNIS